jgi:hypothetical protein
MTNIELLNPTIKPSDQLLRGLYRRSGEQFTLFVLRDEGWPEAVVQEFMVIAKSDGPAIDL